MMMQNQIGELNVQAMRSAQPPYSRSFDQFPGQPHKWGLSFDINMQPGPNGRSAGSISWAGLLNCYFWLDPVKHVTGALFTQILPFYDDRVVALYGEFERELYAGLPADSIDYAIMEKLDGIATIPLDCGWSDLGSWEALDEILSTDVGGNTGRGDTLAVDTQGNLLFADQGTIAVLGVEGLVVVRTGDAVLVMPKSRSQEVRRLVTELAARGREDLL